MKRTVLFSVLLLLLSVVDGRSQVLRWAYTNALPAEFTNGYNLITRSTYDGAGGSVWLINVLPSDPFPAPFSGFSFTRILWLNKNGRPIYTNDMGTDYLDVNVSFVTLEPDELTLSLSGRFPSSETDTNILRRLSYVRGRLVEKNTPLEAGETVSSFNLPYPRASQRGGLFSRTSRLPDLPELVIRRYDK